MRWALEYNEMYRRELRSASNDLRPTHLLRAKRNLSALLLAPPYASGRHLRALDVPINCYTDAKPLASGYSLGVSHWAKRKTRTMDAAAHRWSAERFLTRAALLLPSLSLSLSFQPPRSLNGLCAVSE